MPSAPCPTAGSISLAVKYPVALSLMPRRFRPAAASMIAWNCPSSSLRSLVSRLPRRSTILRSGRKAASWALRRRLLVPTVAPCGSSARFLYRAEIKASWGFSRNGIIPKCSSSGSSEGTSFMLWTARSTSLRSRASSISLTNKPLPPTMANGTSRILSPLVTIISNSTETPGCWASICFLTQVDWVVARRLPRVPIFICFLMPEILFWLFFFQLFQTDS